MGAMHYGPRPVFKDSVSLEVHVLDAHLASVPSSIDVEIIGRIRDVENFESPEALTLRIRKDIQEARGMLSA